jgi:DNA-binding CsgD family transcriptional regulator
MNNEIPVLIPIKKAFGKQHYRIKNTAHREKILNHPLINNLYSVGKSFAIIANTNTWEIESVTGDTKDLTGYTAEEIYHMGGEFVMSFTVQEHLLVNMATVKACMEYSNSIPEEQREFISAIYYYHGRKKNGDIIAVQHQTIPVAFDEQKIPYIFCNIYSDISYLDPQNIPHGVMVNKFTREVFHLSKNSLNLEKKEDLFSKREKEIIRLMTNGLTSKEMAEKLHISNDTVRTHRKNILRKAGVSNTISLIRFAIINSIL